MKKVTMMLTCELWFGAERLGVTVQFEGDLSDFEKISSHVHSFALREAKIGLSGSSLAIENAERAAKEKVAAIQELGISNLDPRDAIS